MKDDNIKNKCRNKKIYKISKSDLILQYINILIEKNNIMSSRMDLLHDSINVLSSKYSNMNDDISNIRNQLDDICSGITNIQNEIPSFETISNIDEQCENIDKNNNEENENNNNDDMVGSFVDMINTINLLNMKKKNKPKKINDENSEKEKKIEYFESENEDIESDYDIYKDIIDDEKDNKSTNINNIYDLISIGKSSETYDNQLGIDKNILVKLVKPLKKLSRMIGLNNIKKSVFTMIIFFLQELNDKNMFHNTVIEGPPGVGKTKFGKILGEIYYAMGIVSSKTFKYIKASDLISDHYGATRLNTQRIIDETDGGILFIDEAYALSSGDSRDVFVKECLDTLNINLSEKKDKLIVIIAGYPNQLTTNFFDQNPGLARRFPTIFKMDGYNYKELKNIFLYKLKISGWKIDRKFKDTELENFFKQHHKEFPNFAGDIDNMMKGCKFVHGNRIIDKNPKNKKILTQSDIKLGFADFMNNKRNNPDNLYNNMMYT